MELDEKRDAIENFEIDPDEKEDRYNNMLDECYPEVFGIQPSRILLECDPTAYRCGLVDYVDNLDESDEEEYQELEEEISELEDELSDLEDELLEMEDEP